jgi:hypothetical protein
LAALPAPSTIRVRLEVTFVEVRRMRVVCAWCGDVLADGSGPVSHGICPSCSLTVERAFHKSLIKRRASAIARKRRQAGPTLPLPGFFGRIPA